MSTSPTTTHRRPHPGAWLKAEMMEPSGLTQYRLAQDLGVSQSLVSRLIAGHARITAGLALRLSAYFGNSAEFWLNLQQNYDLAEARATVDTSGIPRFSAAG